MKQTIKTFRTPLKSIIVLVFFSLNPSFSWSQVVDDFAVFCSNGIWEGNIGSFSVTEEGMLNMVGSETGWAYLSTAHTQPPDTECEWHIRINLNFAPSANNFVRFYLMADQSDLSATEMNGYYLQIGENQGNDAVELFYKEGKSSTSLCRGTNGLVNNSFDYNIKVIKEKKSWRIYLDEKLCGEYLLDFECDSDLQNIGGYLGIYCQFTSSNAGKFFFDDVYCGKIRVDTTAPQLVAAEPTTSLTNIVAQFSEKATPLTALQPNNYEIEETGWNPIDVQFAAGHYDKTILKFAEEFTDDVDYHLICKGIKDYSGNELQKDTANFRFLKPKRNDVIISEIMADPFPTVGLPPAEYVELKNRTSRPINLDGWKIEVGPVLRDLPNVEIEPDGYILIVSLGSQSQFTEYQPLAPISSLTITDGGQTITLWSDFNEVIHTVPFKKEWHRELFKKDGGWSLEMTDTDNPCGGADNWASSKAEAGGTPCAVNSVNAENPDSEKPEIRKIAVINPTTLMLYFSETVNKKHGQLPIEIDNVGIDQIEAVSPSNSSWKIFLTSSLVAGKQYTLTLRDSVCDCAGYHAMIGQRICFALPEKPERGDVVINEILSDPPGNSEADFIELYNCSSKTISLKDLRIGSGGDSYPIKSCVIDNEGMQLPPKSYVAMCKNSKLTQEQYYCPSPENILQCDSLPAYTNTNGIVHLTDCNYNIIDKVPYDVSMHYKMLKTTDGVSLEKTHTNADGQEVANWKSAAASAGYATPGYKNSQYADEDETDRRFNITPEIFSPDNDGFDDYTEVNCNFDETENRVSVAIYNRYGSVVKTLANNELCGTEVKYVWDGLTDKGTLARPDLYVIKMQYWNMSGQTKVYKKCVGIARKKGAVY